MKISINALKEKAKERPLDYLNSVFSLAHLIDNNYVHLDSDKYYLLVTKYNKQHTTGTKLKELISWFPIPHKNGCKSCMALEVRMNKWGPDKCELKKSYILGKLRIAALRRGLPFSERLVTILVDKAIRTSR